MGIGGVISAHHLGQLRPRGANQVPGVTPTVRGGAGLQTLLFQPRQTFLSCVPPIPSDPSPLAGLPQVLDRACAGVRWAGVN